MKNFLKRLRRIFKSSTKSSKTVASDTTNGFKPNDGSNPFKEEAVVISLMRLIEQTKEGEYTCEETLDLLDEYVELVSDGQNVAAIMPLVKNHIGDCPDCTERFEALIKIVQYP